MQNDWILDVLADLKAFAVANGLGALAEQLDDTTLVAASEIASSHKEAHARLNGDNIQFGPHPQRVGGGQRA